MAEIKDGWVLVDGVKTHFSWAGDRGPAVVLLHGGGPGASGEMGWRLAIPALAAAGFRVYAPDQLSMGRTDARPHAWPVNGHQSLVDHVDGFVDALCLDRAHLAGNSQGAYVALKFALDHPEKAQNLVLIGSATIATALGVAWPDMEHNPGLIALKNYDYTREAMQRFMESVVNDPSKIPAEVVEARHAMANLPGVREARFAFDAYQARMRSDIRLMRRFSLRDRLRDSGLSVQLVWGDSDRFAPLRMGEDIAAIVPDWTFRVVEAGHQCQTDQPDVVNQILVEHFRADRDVAC